MWFCKNLGRFNALLDTEIPTGLVAPYSGDYTVRAWVLGHTYEQTLTLDAGDPVNVPNVYNEESVTRFTVELPSANQLAGINFLTTAEGEIAFEFTNQP